MKRTGEILRKAREEKDLSLHEIGLSLKINNKILKAIEDGDTSKLPAKTFLRGFVQSYANFLHLNTDEVLAIFYEEMGSTKPTPYKKEELIPSLSESKETTTDSSSINDKEDQIITSEPLIIKEDAPVVKMVHTHTAPAQADIVKSSQAISSLDKNSNFKTYIGLIAIAALLAVIVFVKQMIDKYSKEAEVPSNEVAQTIENATPILFESSDNTMTEIETSPSPLSPNTEPSAPTNTATAAVAAPSAAVTEKPTPTNPQATPETKTPTVAAPPPVAPADTVKKEEPKKTELPTSGKPVELIVEALDGVEIEYSAPNGPIQKIKLSSEQVHTFKSKSGLIINFSNGGVVNLILNGKDIGIPGDLGKPIKLSY